MGIQDIIAIVIALAALAYVVRILVRTFSGRSGCACDTTQSAADGSASASRARLKRRPLVTIDQIGKPSSKPEAPKNQ